MFINFWYPVVRSQDLGMKPTRVRILAHDFVAFRDTQGKAALLSDTCVHRGGSLAGGKCKEDGTVQCPYHGWRYNTDGVCTRIPSIGKETKPPPRARVDSYPVEERYGIVFAFLGDLPAEQRPPILPIEEHGTPEWRATVTTFDINYHYERSIENGLDPAHNEYVHPTHGYQGEREDTYRMTELRPTRENTWGHGFLSTFDAPPPKSRLLRQFRKKGGKMEAGSGTYGPNQMWTVIKFTAKYALHQYLFEAPIDERHTRVFLVNERNLLFFDKAPFAWLNDWLDKKVNERNMIIAQQDIKVMNDLRPMLTPPTRSKELLMPHDRVILQYRDKLDEFEARGWRMDFEALHRAQQKGDTIYAIPCPARRETNAWVLDAVPLVPPRAADEAGRSSSAAGTLQQVAG
jgi:phenylpropionate dioxygenase-like ring-hydroxylating dioxygenase large terminal subunit